MAAGIVITAIGVVLILIGISALRSSRSNAMPLLFRSIHQSTSRSMGIGILAVGIIMVVAGIVMMATA